MSLFVVERDLPGITPEELQSAGLRAKTCCAEISEEGQSVRWIRSFGQLVGFVPPDGEVLVKRVIATGGQTVKGVDGVVEISENGPGGPFPGRLIRVDRVTWTNSRRTGTSAMPPGRLSPCPPGRVPQRGTRTAARS